MPEEIPPEYRPSTDEPHMCPPQRACFRRRLMDLRAAG